MFNSAKIIVSVIHKSPERKVEKLKYVKLEVVQPKIKNKPSISARE